MRIQPNETYEEWATRVQEFELAQALKELAKGADINLVMEAMSARIQQKMLHPILVALRESATNIDISESKRFYEENYIKRYGPKADHIVDELQTKMSDLGNTED